MITALRDRIRPDKLHNQVRAGGKNMARRLYLYSVGAVLGLIFLELVGPLIFLDADGLVLKERVIVGGDFNARVLTVNVKPGDRVEPGMALLTIQSPEAVEKMGEIIGKLAAMTSREAQLKSRARSISVLKPVVKERRERALDSLQRLRELFARRLTTSGRLAEATREVFEAEREEATLLAEEATLVDELKTAGASREEMQSVLQTMRYTYNEGKLIATVSGIVGQKVVSPGSVLRPGEPALEIYRGAEYVVAYLPTSRLYTLEAGDRVIVTDGTLRALGTVQRIEANAEAVPPEFQSAFRSVDRQQVARIEIEPMARPFPINSKIKVAGRISVSNATSFLRSAIAGAVNNLMRIAGVELDPADGATTQFATRPGEDDDIVTGSIPKK